ncbi:MAG: hypothetical protein ABWW66_02095 [Archaeoglobaceae archaeon]
MNTLYTVLSGADDGDKILIRFPDAFSFCRFTSWLKNNFGEIFWIVWTDAAVQRLNSLAKKYGLGNDQGVIVGSGMECGAIRCVERFDVYSDLRMVWKVKLLNSSARFVMNFGVDFLPEYGFPTSRVLEILSEHDSDVLINATFGKFPPEYNVFHDVLIEFGVSEEEYVKYRGYFVKITYPIDNGIAEVGEKVTFNP